MFEENEDNLDVFEQDTRNRRGQRNAKKRTNVK